MPMLGVFFLATVRVFTAPMNAPGLVTVTVRRVPAASFLFTHLERLTVPKAFFFVNDFAGHFFPFGAVQVAETVAPIGTALICSLLNFVNAAVDLRKAKPKMTRMRSGSRCWTTAGAPPPAGAPPVRCTAARRRAPALLGAAAGRGRGRELAVRAGVGRVGERGVGVRAAVDGVDSPVARLDRVGAAAAADLVRAAEAVDRVVAEAAVEHVGAVAARDLVVAVAALDRAAAVRREELVVAAVADQLDAGGRRRGQAVGAGAAGDDLEVRREHVVLARRTVVDDPVDRDLDRLRARALLVGDLVEPGARRPGRPGPGRPGRSRRRRRPGCGWRRRRRSARRGRCRR